MCALRLGNLLLLGVGAGQGGRVAAGFLRGCQQLFRSGMGVFLCVNALPSVIMCLFGADTVRSFSFITLVLTWGPEICKKLKNKVTYLFSFSDFT